MTEIYHRINGSEYRNIFIVGDLHGCYNRLMTQLDELQLDRKRDLLISVGDLIDRGAQSLECLDLITEKWFACVRGNHEQMAIDALAGRNVDLWFYNGGDWFNRLDYEQEILAKALIARAGSLPYVIELETNAKRIVIAHADYPDNQYEFGKEIDLHETVWSRERFGMLGEDMGDKINGADAFYFGHTPIQRKWSPFNLNYIDTGAVFGNLLTIVQVQGGANG
ncbi:metallophosphoesterase [Pantoea sp.]|uniref:metallophosphoesterase n=1 Tax=Pantoea sp. TaxID=69393 RepID=UPI0028AC5F7A|nr:metallophosphoesterase [Pantoea sp.]